ncbi:unnamed protein product [Withania somnifera]
MSQPLRSLLKVIVLGDCGYVFKRFREQYKATMGADFATKEIGERVVTLQIWDTAGQERFHSLGVAFYRGVDCCILVYDENVTKSFETLQHWHEEFIKQADLTEPEKFSFVLISNKVDLEYGSTETVSEKKAKEWCGYREYIQNLMTSTKEDYNVDVAFLCATQLALINEDDHNIWQPLLDEGIIPESVSGIEQQKGGCAC